jgi:hypothetical protein
VSKKTKKVIFFIVEGPTDEDALSTIMKGIFNDVDVKFHVVHGDITTDNSTKRENVFSKIGECIKAEMAKYGFVKKDILKVFHIVDTDGAFVLDNIVYNNDCDVRYFEDRIETNDINKIKNRNHRKSEILRCLISKGKILASVKYSIFYFSCNMEHVLHNNLDALSDEEKICLADDFANAYNKDAEAFKTFIRNEEFAVSGNYTETWHYIMKDNNSLRRNCNLHLMF